MLSGFVGVNQTRCENNKCCWNPSDVSNNYNKYNSYDRYTFSLAEYATNTIN